jgi:hypothetical protein
MRPSDLRYRVKQAEVRQERLDQLLQKHLRVPPGTRLPDSHPVPTGWRTTDLGIAVETELGVPMSADRANSLKTVGAWRALV